MSKLSVSQTVIAPVIRSSGSAVSTTVVGKVGDPFARVLHRVADAHEGHAAPAGSSKKASAGQDKDDPPYSKRSGSGPQTTGLKDKASLSAPAATQSAKDLLALAQAAAQPQPQPAPAASVQTTKDDSAPATADDQTDAATVTASMAKPPAVQGPPTTPAPKMPGKSATSTDDDTPSAADTDAVALSSDKAATVAASTAGSPAAQSLPVIAATKTPTKAVTTAPGGDAAMSDTDAPATDRGTDAVARAGAPSSDASGSDADSSDDDADRAPAAVDGPVPVTPLAGQESTAIQQVVQALQSLGGGTSSEQTTDVAAPTASQQATTAATVTGRPAAAPGGVVTIQLDPEHLGRVQVTLRMTSDSVDIRIEVENAQTLTLLNKDKHILSAAVEAAGRKPDLNLLSGLSAVGSDPAPQASPTSSQTSAQTGSQQLSDPSTSGRSSQKDDGQPGKTPLEDLNDDVSAPPGRRTSNRPDGGLYL